MSKGVNGMPPETSVEQLLLDDCLLCDLRNEVSQQESESYKATLYLAKIDIHAQPDPIQHPSTPMA